MSLKMKMPPSGRGGTAMAKEMGHKRVIGMREGIGRMVPFGYRGSETIGGGACEIAAVRVVGWLLGGHSESQVQS
jgi:hypothetical protein